LTARENYIRSLKLQASESSGRTTYIQNEENVAVVFEVGLHIDDEFMSELRHQCNLIARVLDLIFLDNLRLLQDFEGMELAVGFVSYQQHTAVRAGTERADDIK
jgi:hypothetical protein